VSSFPSDIKELQFYFGDDKSDKVRAYPAKGLNVPLYILGSSPESAYLAAELGLPYAFASHFAPRFLTQAVEIYRKEFKPSDVLDKPKVIVGLNAIVADTDSEAKLLATTSLQFFLNVVTGERSGMKPPVPDIESRIPPHILSMAKSMTACSVIGSPKTVKAQLEQLQKQVNADEFMVVSYIYDKDKQARSYELILEAVDG
jgi:luciferase family oxidoreductase, group 1